MHPQHRLARLGAWDGGRLLSLFGRLGQRHGQRRYRLTSLALE